MELECEFKGQCRDEGRDAMMVEGRLVSGGLCSRCGNNKVNLRPSHFKTFGVKPVFEPREGKKGL